ncbi:hypothetical protein AB0D42_34860 [Streptomyces sp. NPDC048304]|uniref:hypothetical protein n=1 Tax=Streptomyces sp. NPDC048304 TaxID=3154820 RepID=UPI0034086464
MVVGDHGTMVVHNHLTPQTPLDVMAETLAAAVEEEWNKEAGLRRLKARVVDETPLPVRWEVSGRRVADRVAGATAEGVRDSFGPLPGLRVVTREQLLEGGGLNELYEVYGGLASGRILLVGREAAGKTAALVLLLLKAIEYRREAKPENQRRIPVPVLLPLEGWDPRKESALDWAATQIARRYRVRGPEEARQLLKERRVALFLDGLDEVVGKLRGAMVRALGSERVRMVVASRVDEAERTAQKMRLRGAVGLEIQPVKPEVAADYLLNQLPDPPPPAWHRLTSRLLHESDSAVAEALSSPLAIGLVRDVYREDDPVDELLDTARFPDSRTIEDHLLDHAVAAAYTPAYWDPRPRYSPETAERTLRFIAARLAQEGGGDLSWWHIPGWANPRPRAVVVGVVVGMVYGVVSALGLWRASGPLSACVAGPLLAVAAGGLAGRQVSLLAAPQPLPSAGWRDIFSPATLKIGVMCWLSVGLMNWFGPQFMDPPMPVWLDWLTALPFGFAATMASGPGYQLMVGGFLFGLGSGPWFNGMRQRLTRRTVTESRSIGPRDVWRHHGGLRLVLALVSGLAVALVFGCYMGWSHGLRNGVASALVAGLWATLFAGPVGNLTVATALTAVQLAFRERTPVRLMAFLDDAHHRNLLRVTGPVYQFRHARLQERLTQQE